MKNKKYSIKKLSTGVISIIIGIGTMKVGIVNAQMESDNKVVIDEKGVIPDVEPIPPENVIEEPIRKPPIKSEEKPALKITEKPKEKPLGELLAKPTETLLIEYVLFFTTFSLSQMISGSNSKIVISKKSIFSNHPCKVH